MPLVIVDALRLDPLRCNEPFRQLFRFRAPAGRAHARAVLRRPSARALPRADADRRRRSTGWSRSLRRCDGSTFPAATASRLIEYEGDARVRDLGGRPDRAPRPPRRRSSASARRCTRARSWPPWARCSPASRTSSTTRSRWSSATPSMLQELAADDGDRGSAPSSVHAAAERCARIVKTFLAMARQRPPQRGPVATCHAGGRERALELRRLRPAHRRRRGQPRARARPAAGLGRRRPAAPGADQPDRQRAAGAGAERAAAPARDRAPSAGRRRS